MALQNRMARELKSLKRQPPEGVCVWPEEGGGGSRGAGAVRLAAQLQGPPGTPYEGGVFRVAIDVPDRYPFEPPKVAFATRVFHPNIDSSGRVCLDVLDLPPKGSWRPSLNLTTVLAAVRQLLAEPNPDDPLDHEATEAYLRNRPGFDATARRLVAQHARGGAAAATGGGGGAAGDEVAPGTASDAGTSAGTAGGSSEAGGSGGVGGRGTKGVAGGACAEAPDAQGDAATARHAAVHRSACETGAHTALEHPAVVASPSGVGRPAGEAAVPAAAGWEAAGGPTQSPCRKHARGAPEEAADATPRAKAPRTL